MAKISIVVPVYKVENIIDVCIESILSQSFSDIELILVDDGSPDKSGIICDEWAKKDSRIKVIHQENKGQCAARNAGMEVADGEYLMFVDSDDYVNFNICKILYDILVENDLDVVRCSYQTVKEHLGDYGQTREILKEAELFTKEEALTNFVTGKYSSHKPFTAIVCAALYKKSLWKDVKFPEGLIYEEGFVLPKVLLKSKKLGFVDAPLYYYYENSKGTMSGGFSQRGLKSIGDWKEIHFLLYDEIPSLRRPTAERWVEKYISTYESIINSSDIDEDGYYKSLITKELKTNKAHLKKNLSKELYKSVCAFVKGYGFYKLYNKANSFTLEIKNKLGI